MRITIAVARRATLVAALLLALGAASASASPTTLDPTFDGDGIARPGVDRGQVLGRDLQGRVYVAGGGRLTRLRADGTRDLAYNGGNTVPTGLTITALAVLPNGGGAIVAGTDFDPGDDAHPIGVVLARYDEAGHYVPSYGSGGQARIPLPGTSTGEGDVVRDAVADPAGDVWVVGTREDRAYVVGVNANGEPMTTFGDPPATPGLRRLGTGTTFEAIARDADRRLVAVGSTTAGGTSPRWLAARFTETGRPDTTWDADGVSEPGSGATGTSLLRDVTVSGSMPSVGGIAADQGGVARLAGARLTSTGALDTSFGGGDGRVEAALGGGALPAGSGWIARDGNDTVLAGTAAGTGQIGVMRVDGAGRPDPFFTSDRSGLAVFKLGADQGELVRGVDAVGGKTLLAGDSTQTGGTGTGTGGGGTSSVPFVARLGDGEDQRPIAVATAKPATQSDGVEVLLDSSGSRDDQGAALSYAWDLGDGATSTAQAPEHVYPAPGTYTAKLTVRDPAGLSDTATTLVTITVPDGTVGLDVDVPFEGKLLSGQDVTFTATATTVPAGNGPIKIAWDWGEGRRWTEEDLADPSRQGILAPGPPDERGPLEPAVRRHAYPVRCDPDSPFAAHNPADRLYEVTPTCPPGTGEARTTYLLRVLATDRYGHRTLRAKQVTVTPDRVPVPQADAFSIAPQAVVGGKVVQAHPQSTLEFTDDAHLVSRSVDPDTAASPGRDAIVREEWDVDGDGSIDVTRGPVPCSEPADAFCVDQNAFTVNFFDRARDPQQPPLTDVQLDALPPAPKAATDKAPADPTQLKAFEDAQSEARSRIAASAATLPHGTDQPLARRVTLTVTDRSGRQGRRDFSFPVRPRAAPAPAVQVKQVGGNAVQGGKVYDPIAADPVPGNGRGTEVSLDLSRTTADPRGEIAFHVLEIGHPSVAPCDPKKAGAGCKQVDVQKNADLKRTPQDPVVRTLVVPGTTKAVSLTFPKPSGGVPWSILDTVYDETGDSRRLRLDGFEVLGQPKDCSTLSGFNLDQGNTAVDATCAYVGANAKLVMTAQPITLNGARLRAEPGLNLVLNRCAKAKAVVYATSAALAAASKGCDGPPVAVGTKLQLLLDDKPAATLGPITQADVDERKVPTTRLAKATYQRFDLRAGSDPDVALRDKGASTTTFFLTYPDVFASPEGDPAADAVAVRGVTVPKELVIAPFTGSVDAKAQAARARLRALSDAGPTVLSVPDGLSLGGIPIPPTTFTLDDKTGVFSAEAEVKIPLLPSAVKIRIRLRNGAFELAEGQFDADVPIGTFKLTSFKFRIERVMDEKTGKPVVELEAKVGFADASGALIEGTGGITVRPSPFYLKVEAQATIIKLLPVSAMIQVFGSDGFSFAGDLAKSFGPVSVTAHVDGEFGAGGFNVEGGGEACLFACLGAKALVSSDAIAACGSLKLFFVKLQAGFGFRYASGLDVFVGSCDLSPYRAKNVIQTRAVGVESPTLGARYGWDIGVGESAMSVVSAYATPGEPTLLGSTPSVALLHDGVEMARTTAFLGDYFQDPGSGIVVDQDPQVGVTRFLVPNPGAGGWSVQTLDKDRPIQFPVYSLADPPLEPELFTTRKVRKPSKGRLKAVMSGKEPLRGAIQPVSGVRGITKADRIQAGWAPSTALVAQGRAATRQATPGVAGTLAGQLIPTVPDLNALVTAGVPATMTMTGTRVPVEAVTDFQEGELAQFDFAAPRLPPGTRATFVEQGAHCHQQLGEAITPADGVLKGSLVFTPCRANDTFAGGPVALPHHDVVVRITNRLDQPRGSITLTSFPFKDPKALPKLPKLKARYLAKAGKLVLDPGEPYYLGDEPWVDVQVDAGPWRSSFPLTDALVQQLKAQQVGGGRKARAAAAVRRRSTRTQDWSFTLDGLPRGLRGVEVRLTRPRPEGAPASFAIGRTTMVRPEAERGGKRGGRPAGRRAGRR